MAGSSLVVKEPVGVVAAFPAYNFALAAVGQKVGPALVAGCTVVVKVPEPNPLAIFVVGEICAEIGLPPGVVNIVAARAQESEYLVRHPGVDMVSFTGSAEVGAKIAAACGELIRPCVLELGGKSAAIVLEDAKMEDVLPALVGASVGTNSGQNCAAQTRLLVPESQYRAYAQALADAFASLKTGDPMEADTAVGPLVTSHQRDRAEYYVDVARKEGATIACGGRRPSRLKRGWYYEPTLVTDAHNGMRVSREEIFGPVASLIPHRGEDDAVRIANDSELGLAGSVFTADTAHGFEIARRVRTGTFSVNTFAADLGSPFGGFKKSGLGREHGPHAVQEYLLTKTISIDPSGDLPESVTRNVPHGTGPGTH
jgi:acyl-CoA reductase-like NAD-dependent aldehyde dehydrogenase